jgi:hypothetical protein
MDYPQTLVVSVANTDRKAAAFHPGVEIEHAEHLHTVFGNGVFLFHDSDVPKSQGLNQSSNDFGMRDRSVSTGSWRCCYQS